MRIKHDLFPKQKKLKQGFEVSVDLFPLGQKLYDELERIGIITRIKDVPHLGIIRVNKKLSKSRYDYVVLQLYFHQLIKKKIQNHLKFTYNNYLRTGEFLSTINCVSDNDKISIADVIQILTIVYNIGHFYTTFTASRAIIMLAEMDKAFVDSFNSYVSDEKFLQVSERIFSEHDYQRMHLLNSLIVLEHCNQEIQSVKLAKEIIYAYIMENDLNSESKLHYVFSLFRIVRNVAYITYDLQIANTPFTLDILNEKAMEKFFQELLSEFNNRQSASNLVESIIKLLDDSVYNESDNVICYYQISKKIYRKIRKEYNGTWEKFYTDFWLNVESSFNYLKYKQNHDYVQQEILKLTFEKEQRSLAQKLFKKLEKFNNTRVGYYDRYFKRMTMVISIKKACNDKKKVAFRIFKNIINFLRRVKDIKSFDFRFLLVAKFFLRYLFNENQILIRPIIDNEKCVFCTKGSKQRIYELELLLKNANGSEDEQHEVCAIKNYLSNDFVNDVTITISGSILVYDKSYGEQKYGQKLCEFDGIIIYPNRKEKQVVLLEAKNTEKKPSYGKKCLAKKLNRLKIVYKEEEIVVDKHDAYYEMNL